MVHKLLPPFLLQQYEEEVQQLSKAMLDSTSDPSLLAVRLCRKGALLRKVSHSSLPGGCSTSDVLIPVHYASYVLLPV